MHCTHLQAYCRNFNSQCFEDYGATTGLMTGKDTKKVSAMGKGGGGDSDDGGSVYEGEEDGDELDWDGNACDDKQTAG